MLESFQYRMFTRNIPKAQFYLNVIREFIFVYKVYQITKKKLPFILLWGGGGGSRCA